MVLGGFELSRTDKTCLGDQEFNSQRGGIGEVIGLNYGRINGLAPRIRRSSPFLGAPPFRQLLGASFRQI